LRVTGAWGTVVTVGEVVAVSVAVTVPVTVGVVVAVCVVVTVGEYVAVFEAVIVGVWVPVTVGVTVLVTVDVPGVMLMVDVNVGVFPVGAAGLLLLLQPAIKAAGSNAMSSKLPIIFITCTSPDFF
jgi:hypothetical protein